MERFQRHAPLELVTYPEPPIEDRSGPALSSGGIFKLLATVAADELSPAALDLLDRIDPEAWYRGQILESLLSELEDRDPGLPYTVGRLTNLLMREDFRRLGLTSPERMLEHLPGLWPKFTRGDTGWWRTHILGPGRARVEMQQPYNCRFEAGGLFGMLESCYLTDLTLDHPVCMRDGAEFCVLEVRWSE